MTVCAVKWCVLLPAEGSGYCAIHRDHPRLRKAPPEEGTPASSDCVCEGTGICGTCDGEGECFHCGAACEMCEGTGECTACE